MTSPMGICLLFITLCAILGILVPSTDTGLELICLSFLGIVLLFGIHELGHAIAGRAMGMRVNQIPPPPLAGWPGSAVRPSLLP
jgi:hypothetical protein